MNDTTAQSLESAASLLRLSYALGLLLAPDAMSAHWLAAAANGNAWARMTTRALGAVHGNLALFTLRAARRAQNETPQEQHRRLLWSLNLGCDLGDLIATLMERRTGDLPPAVALGSVILQSIGISTWSTLLANR